MNEDKYKRPTYYLSELRTILEEKKGNLNIPDAFLCLVTEVMDLIDKGEYLEKLITTIAEEKESR